MKKVLLTISLLCGFFFSQANFDYINPDSLCSVTFDTIQNGACVQAVPTGTAPFTFFWSDSTFLSSICPDTLGTQYCVTVVDATGCAVTACIGSPPPPTCSVYISEDSTATDLNLTANASGSAPFSYFWNTGQSMQTITVPSNGNYCVTITDASGCANVDCITINVIPSNCSVSVAQVPNANCVVATPTGTAPFTYLWSDGSTMDQACSNSPFYDTLCVTVTDANGCVAYGCEVAGNLPTCGVYINFTTTGLTAVAYGDTSSQYTYVWSSGETTESISPTVSGNYCVTITSVNGCTATACMFYSLYNDITGYISIDSINGSLNSNNTFMVYLIEYDSTAGSLTALDSIIVTTNAGNFGAFYGFSGLASGDYLVKVAIQPGSDDYDNYLPTYNGDVLYWHESTPVSIPNPNITYTYINMIYGTNPGGPGFIGGLIIDGANLTPGQVDTRGDGDPLENVNVLLLTDTDEPVTHTVTDADGKFEFSGLSYGTYKVVVEVLGKDPGVKMVTLSADNQDANINFEVNETFVTKIEDVLNGASLKVFPNPITDILNIQVDMKQSLLLNVSVTNVLGETLVSENERLNEGTQTMQVNLNNLPTGFYFLNLSDGESTISRKIMKN